VTVPNLNGMSFDEAKKFLETRELSYEVTDSAYNSEASPLTVLEQYPRPLSKVKTGRKINLKLNARSSPLVSFPDLTGSSFDFAQKQLGSLDIKIKTIKYRPDIAANSILESSLNGNQISTGQRIHKGSKIDLIIGSSTDTPFPLPDFSGMAYDEVEAYLLGLNLKIGEITPVTDDNAGSNVVQKQNPIAGDSVKHFDTVDLWIFNFQKME
jgi:beta-lactam-binding protein with PASTA domain